MIDGVISIIEPCDWLADLSERAVLVLYAYLDDSGSHDDSPAPVLAGYVSTAKDWKYFERKALALWRKHRIEVFRAKLFDHGQGDFRGWSDDQRLKFAAELYDLARPVIKRGVVAAVLRHDYELARASQPRNVPQMTPLSYCLQVLIRKLSGDSIWEHIKSNGLSVIIESSGAPDGGLRSSFDLINKANSSADVLRSFSTAPKASSRALQLADFLAYYSWQFALTAKDDSLAGRTPFLDIAESKVTTLKSFAHKFEPDPSFGALLASSRRRRKRT